MRKQLVKTVLHVMEKDEHVVLLLGDIGVYGFREAFDRFPKRTYNIGICEQASVSLAAGLALEGFIPVFHTIAPFMVERAFEQIKIDFGYQKLNGNFISVGGSYDYSKLGCTHHCPGDVALIKTIPYAQTIIPGHSLEFDSEFKFRYDIGERVKYFRLSERENMVDNNPGFLKLQPGSDILVIAVGPMLDRVIEACEDLPVSILYTTGQPHMPFVKRAPFKTVVVVEPFYEGTMAYEAQTWFPEAKIRSVGVPHKFLTTYGRPEDHDEVCWLSARALRMRIGSYL